MAPGKTWLHLATHGYFAPAEAWQAIDAKGRAASSCVLSMLCLEESTWIPKLHGGSILIARYSFAPRRMKAT